MPAYETLVRRLAQKHNVNPDLAAAVMKAESGGNPNAKSPAGAIGLMQLMPGTAKDLGVNPYVPEENIEGGVRYLAQMSKKFDTTPEVLAAYNAGPGNVQKYGGVPPFRETQSYVSKILGSIGSALSPRSAEASEKRQQPKSDPSLDALDAIIKGQPVGQPAAQPAQQQPQEEAPSADPLDALDAIIKRGSGSTAPPTASGAGVGVSPTSGAPVPLPAQGGEPDSPASVTVLPQMQPVQAPVKPPVQQQYAQPSPFNVPGLPRINVPGTGDFSQDILDIGKQGAGMLIGAGVGGALGMAGSKLGPVGAFVGEMIGNIGSRMANIRLGLEQPGTVGDIIAGAAPIISRAIPGTRAMLQRSRGGQAIQSAEEATEASRQAAQQVVEERVSPFSTPAMEAQRQRAMAAQAEAQGAQAGRQQAFQAGEQARVSTRQQEIAGAEQANIASAQAREAAIAAQRQAVETTRGIPGKFAPPTPSRTYYAQLNKDFPDLAIDTAPVKKVVQEVIGEAPVLPPRFERMAAELEGIDPELPFKRVHEYLKELGPLTRNQDSQVRKIANRLYAGFNDALESRAMADTTTAQARDVLLAANAARRREGAVDVLTRFRQNAISRDAEGNWKVNPAQFSKNVEKEIENNTLFRGAFDPNDLAKLRADVEGLFGTPAIPAARTVEVPPPYQPRDIPPGLRQEITPSQPTVSRPDLPVPEVTEPTLPEKQGLTRLLERMALFGGLGGITSGRFDVGAGIAAGVIGKEIGGQIIGQAMLNERIRPQVLQLLQSTGGQLNPAHVAAIRAALASDTREQK